MQYNLLTEDAYKRFQPVLEHKDLAPIQDPWKRRAVAQAMLNTEFELINEHANMMGGRGFLAENPIAHNFMGASS